MATQAFEASVGRTDVLVRKRNDGLGGERKKQGRKDVQQHIALMDISCGALGLGRIRVYHVTKNADTNTMLNQQLIHTAG